MNYKIDNTIHSDIRASLDKFTQSTKIPNIIFHGPNGAGKRTLVNYFINSIYKNNHDNIKQYVIYVDCAKCNGIRYVREDLKFFAKSQIHNNNKTSEHLFKTIVMFNSDKLTFDAQSALRRCIEVYNHSTRFFIIVENKYKLLRPILSRFSELYIPYPIIDGNVVNLNKYDVQNKQYIYDKNDGLKILKARLDKECETTEQIEKKTNKLYELGYSAVDIMKYIENKYIDEPYKWTLLLAFQTIKSEFRNEKLLMFFLIHKLYFRLDDDLENILTM